MSQLYEHYDAVATVSFQSDYNHRKLKLFEVTDEILNEIIAKDQSSEGSDEFKLIGEKQSSVVLCTEDKTYSVKKVESSNRNFLISSSITSSFEITNDCADYYEITLTQGNTKALKDLLLASEYDGDVMNDANEANAKTIEEIQCCVQASKNEIEKALETLGVVEINGKMRLLSIKAKFEVTKAVFDTLIESNISIDSVDEVQLMDSLPRGSDVYIAKNVLREHGSVKNNIWSLDRNKGKINKIAFVKVKITHLYTIQLLFLLSSDNNCSFDIQ